MTRITLPILFILLAIGGFIFYVNPHYKEVKANNIKLAKINDALKKANQLKDIRDKLALERNKISDLDLARISKMIPDSVENIGLTIELNNIARDKGMELLNPSIGASAGGGTSNSAAAAGAGQPGTTNGLNIGPDAKKYGSLTMSFSVNTTYEKFIDFLKELEHTLRLVDIKQITFASPDPKTGKTTFTVTMETYWLK